MIYNIYFDVAALFINVVLVLLAFFRKTPPKTKNVVFRLMLLSNLAATIFDILSTYTISFPQNYSIVYNYLINILYYLFHNCSALLYLAYGLLTDVKRTNDTRIRKTIMVVFSLVFISIITTPFTKLVFYFDNNLVYQHGPFLYVLYAVALISVIFVLYLKLSNKDTQSTFQIITNVSYSIALFSAFVFHIINNDILIELFAIDLGYLVMYVSMDNPEQYLYKTIKIYNKRAFDDYIYHKTSKNKKFQILIFKPKDSDNYKKQYSMNQMFAIEKSIIAALMNKKIENKFYVLSEFCYAIVCDDYKSEIERIQSILEKGILVEEKAFSLEMSFAIVRYPEIANNNNDLFIILDDLIYRINNQVSNEPLEANPNILLTKEKRKSEMLLLDAIKNKKFFIEYEPIFAINSDNALNAEAKLMIKDKNNIIPMDNKLYSVADEDGLIVDIDEIMLKHVSEFIEKSSIQNLGVNNIVVNLSMIELTNINFINRLNTIIKKYKIPCDHISFKLIDLNMNVNADIITKNMNEIYKLGFKFVVDKYGENSINVSSLINLPIIGVKMGENITKLAAHNKERRIIFAGFVKILKKLNYSVALGDIRNVEEDKLAKALKIDFVQGPYYAKQMSEKDFIKFNKEQLMTSLSLINRN